jgi:outer membrane lipoprotein SlyB
MLQIKRGIRVWIAVLGTVSVFGCATTSTTSTTLTAPDTYPRYGTVEAVREIVRRVQGNPVGGAVAGALIGGVLFGGHGGPSTLFGATAGAAAGAALSQGSSENRIYEVRVRFEDGSTGVFRYAGFSPYRPGEQVVLTPNGLAAAGPIEGPPPEGPPPQGPPPEGPPPEGAPY